METKNTLYPIFLKLEKIEVLIIGAGAVGLEKLTYMLKSSPQANITIVSRDFHYKVVELSHFYSNVSLIEKEYHKSDLENVDLLIVATDNKQLNSKIKQQAENQHILTNVADNPELCDFYLGGVVTKGALKLGISTNGQSPTLAKKMRMYFEDVLPDEVGFSADLLNKIRKKIKTDLHHKIENLNNVTIALNANSKVAESLTIEKKDFKIYLN
ncbi:MAG: bifunctional precorrin-2 dehydrogenase/sirohydrochlorin ferrochelatase [Flavobacteriales bacterium]|nr:bifunctional precorrin-2 dehydrogenase/sirohydrochlorin ferrochelatase [Flavobacteriales bacterium]MCB9364295.1 bifunctional precorrin-2 dehydrogenase/sirohydrochlorin ferrochelatase [Flavobacteriales bacterium]